MKAIKIIILVGFIYIPCLYAQTDGKEFAKEFTKAEKYFPDVMTLKDFELDENAKKALSIYLQLLKADPHNANLNYRIGVCYLNSRNQQFSALSYLERAITSTSTYYNKTSATEKNAPVIAYKFLGDACLFTYKFDEAIKNYNTFLSKYKANNITVLDNVKRKIAMCNNAKELVAQPVNVKIENMGSAINTTYPDYSPIVSADENMIIFTSRRPGNVGDKTDEYGNYYENIYISEKKDNVWQKAENIGSPINTDGNEASVAFAPDGQQILIYRDDNGDGNLYSTSLSGDKWSKPVKLNENINTPYWETTGCISADGNTLYFASNRPGGYGGRDIYKSVKTIVDGDWGVPVNLGSTINTPYEDDAPFIHSDGITLYFSSNGHKTMGGFDVFSSIKTINDTTWSEPVNIGYPINTTDDDIYFMVSPDKTHAYYSSFRDEGMGEKDNYMLTFIDTPKCSPIIIYQGEVRDAYGAVIKNVEITVTDITTNELVGQYQSNSITGKYLFILTPGRNYSICYSAEGFMFCSVNKDMLDAKNYCEINNVVQLPSITVGSKIVLNNIFFDFDKTTLRPESKAELEKLFNFLTKYSNLKVEISGHTDSKGDASYNNALSENRAKVVVNYLTDKGIKPERMVAKGYGATNPAAPNENKDGTDNPEGRQLNRRTELKIIGM